MKESRPSLIRCLLVLALIMIFLWPAAAPCADKTSPSIPKELDGWKGWVLHGKESSLCPSAWDNGGASRCQWPSRLSLSLTAGGGRFDQSWLMFDEDWILLPGNRLAWPQSVSVDGAPAAVMDRNGSPAVRLPKGKHQVAGRFIWDKLPEMILVPPSTGLVDLRLDAKRIDFPEMDEKGRLWLQQRKEGATREDRLTVRLFRRIDDAVPMQVTTRVLLTVSGRSREVRLPDLMLGGATPIRLESPLPAKLTPDGVLVCQVRPGQWGIDLTTRLAGPVTTLGCKGAYGPEIWSFQAENHLRMVEVSGAPSQEPGRTDMPDAWKHLPAYVLSPGGSLTFKEIRRGDPAPGPDRLSLQRTWWLDFNGAGFTVHDAVTGTMSRHWYLAMQPPAVLGRVTVDGEDQLITRQGVDHLPGVALRRGNLRLAADSRIEGTGRRLPAVGWDHDFETVSATLNLPPGWRLVAAGGVDNISGTWIQRWTLLDFFLALIIGLAVMKLRGAPWGLLALVTMALTFHEPGAPRLVWLSLLAAMALIRILPAGWFRRLIKLWWVVSVGVLLVLAVVFMAQQIRWGLYPQLAPPAGGWRLPLLDAALQEKSAPVPAMPSAPQGMMSRKMTRQAEPASPDWRHYRYPQSQAGGAQEEKKAVFAIDPNAVIQTGPGLPTWHWQRFPLSWSGPVERHQTLRLWLTSPGMNLILGFLRALLMAALIAGLLDIRAGWRKVTAGRLPPAGAVVAAMLLLLLLGWQQSARAAYPSPALLNELQQRLLEKPDCLPHCASLSRMALTIDPGALQILLRIDAAVETAVPLPASRSSWSPDTVLLDRLPAAGLSRDAAGGLWALVPAGVHTIVLKGAISGDVLQIPLPMPPHLATAESRGWTVQGIHDDGSVDRSLRISRIQPSAATAKGYGPSLLPAFFHVQRTLHLALTWRISTTIERISPPGAAVTLLYPLLPGEAVTTAGVHVEGRMAQIVFSPQATRFRFESDLAQAGKIELKAPEAVPWTETWILDASPIWQCDLSGIPVVHHQDSAGQWQPQWAPWPGEVVDIRVSRPKAVEGKTVTIDSARLDWTPGMRFNRAELTLSIRTSRGGQHEITLPEGADLQRVTINGRSLPVRLTGNRLTLPLTPGAQRLSVAWHQPAGAFMLLRSPRVLVGADAVNVDVAFHLPENRWILLAGGPRLGPAVLFWSYLVVVLLAAFGLWRIGLAPLKLYQWVLLGLGLTQVPILTALVVVAWLPALGLRGERIPPDRWWPFNGAQVGLVILTVAALWGLYGAVERGLLGIPDMQIAGNHATRQLLLWTQDRIASALPRPWALVLPLWVYRVLMLLWSLWLALSLLKWLQWGWQCFSTGGLWRKAAPRRPKEEAGSET